MLRRELHRIRHQVPDNLLQTTRIARHRAHVRVDHGLNPETLRVSGRLDGGDGVIHDERQLHGLHVQTYLARDDPRDVEHVLHDLRQPRRVPLERLEAARGLVGRQDTAAQQS
jgi:hypothetical protein